MVLALIFSEVLNSCLGTYIENLDSRQFQIGVWGGDIVLNDLQLKASALDGLNLPIKLVHGVLGKLVVKLPWKQLFSANIDAVVEDLYLLVVPNQEVKYDAEKEEKMAFEAKQAEIQRVEEAKKKEAAKDEPKPNDTFTEKVIANIVRNLQLKIRNIHIRYEDKITHPGSPFSLGVTLKNLEMITTDESWIPTVYSEAVKIVFKLLDLEGLAFYWNCESDLYSTLPKEDLANRFLLEIATKTTKPTDYSYILGPINSQARLRLNTKPEIEKTPFSTPKVTLNIDLETLAIGVSKSQYSDIIALSDSMSRLAKGSEFRQYRPDLQEYKGHAKEWWHFAYQCILESDVRRRKRNWDWNHISKFRQMCREYGNLYQTKLQSRRVSSEVGKRLTELEKELDAFNIIIIRQRVELEAARPAVVEPAKGGWFGGWFGNKPAQDSKDASGATSLAKRFEEAMTPEEKGRLYKAIDYQENAAPAEYPIEYVDTTCTFVLRKLEVLLRNDELQTPIVLNSELSGVKCKISRRVAANALKVGVNVDDLVTYGLQQDDFLPKLVSSNVQKEKKVLLDVVFETNPLDGSCDKRIYLTAEPLRIIYDAQTINRTTEIFKVPESSALEKLSSVAGNSLSNIKQLSATGMQHAISQHSHLDVKISIHAPICLLPYGGKYLGEEHLLIVNLGLITIDTEPRKLDIKDIRQLQLSGANEDEILREMIAQTYDEYKVNFTELQIILGEGSEDWETYMRQSESTKMHILNPVNLRLKLYKCLLTDDPRLPLSRITGELPSVNVTLTDTRLVMLLDLLMSIPFQSDEEEELLQSRPLSESKSLGSSMMLIQYLEMQQKAKSAPSKLKKPEGSSQLQEFTTLDMNFVMSEMSLNLNHQEHSEAPVIKVINFQVTNLELGLVQQTFNKKIEARLASIDINYFRSEALIPLISTPFSTGSDQYLFNVVYTQVDKDSPEFHSKYFSCESNVFLHFSSLNVLLHQESLQELMKFQTDTQNDLNEIMNSKPSRKVQHLASKTSIRSGISRQISEIGAKSSAKFLPAVKKKKARLVVETVLFKLNANLDQVEVKFVSDLQEISLCAIKGVTSDVLVKKSYTQIKAKLLDMVITDLNQKSVHKQILTVSDEYALDADIVMFNLENLEVIGSKNIDMSVNVTMGRLKIVFLNWFITNMLDFLNKFQAAQEKIRAASAAAADAAKQNMKDVYEKAQKISLAIDLKAPYIIVPLDSSSYHAIEVDLGHMAIKNNFIVLEILNENLNPAVVDEMKLKLTDMKVRRILLDKEHKVVNTSELLEPLTFILTVRRNLSTSWYEAVPDISVAGSIMSIKLLLSQADYQMLMGILSGNLAEGKTSETPPQPPPKPKTDTTSCETTAEFVIRNSIADSTASNRSATQRLVEERVHIFLKFNFAMESFIIDLFTGAAETDTPVFVKKEPKTALGRFSLLGLSMKGRMLSDNSMVVSMLLVNCLLDDMRAGREDKLNRLIERKSVVGPPVDVLSTDAQEAVITPHSMIDITYQRTKTDMFSDVRIYSFTVILSMDYLNKIAEFFKQPSTTSGEVTATASKTQIQKVESSPEENLVQQTINLKVEMPDIILVEHMDNVDTNAMILNTEIILNARMCGKHQVLNGTIKDIQLYTCCYNPKKRAETRGEVMHPVTVSVAGSTPEDEGLHLEVIFTDIRIRVSPHTIELLNRVLATMSGGEATSENDEDELKDHSSLWDFISFGDNEFWFLKTDLAQDALAVESIESNQLLIEHHAATRKKQLCFLTIPSLVFTVEAGVGNRTLPMLLLESSFRGYVNDWSSKISIDTSLTLQMGYYNSNLALWESLIEPVEVIEDGKSSYVPWEIKLEVAMNESSEQPVSPVSTPVADSFEQIEAQLQPAMSINVSSINNLELTVTKTCLDVLKNLGNAFSNAVKSTETKQIKRSAAFLVQNDTGIPITLSLDRSTFAVEGSIESVEVILESDANVSLTLKSSAESHQKLQLKQEITRTRNEIAEHLLYVRVEQANCELSLPVVRADKRFFLLNYRAFKKDNWGLVSDVKVDDGVKVITLRSIVQVHNHFNIPVEIFYMTEKGDELKSIAIIQPDVTFNVPLHAVYSITNELFFSVDGYSVTTIPYIWKDLQSNVEVKKTLLCTPKSENISQEPFVIQAVGEIEQIYYENTTRYTMASTCFNIHLRPSVVVKNCLPVDIICCGQNIVAEILVKAGETIQLPNVNPGNSYVVIRLPHYLEKEWSCRREIPSAQPEFCVWQFDSHDSVAKMTLDLGMHVLDKNGTVLMSLYCPFWMLNKTGLMLSYKTSDENLNILHHPANFKGPILFSFNAKNFFGKKKASVRIEYGEWSDKFSLDVAGSSGVVACRSNNQIYQIGVHNQLTYNGLTKQVTFTPYYILINNAPFIIECQEFDRPADAWKTVEPKSCTALWPKSERDDKLLKLKIENTEEISAPFLFTESHTTLLKLKNKYGGVNVDIQLTEGGVFISFAQYQPGMAPALIINHTPYTMSFWEKESVQIRKLYPNHHFLHTWENPSGPRVLAWDIGRNKELNDDLRKDGGGEFSPKDDFTVYWVSFLNGMQRTLLFTTEQGIAEDAQSAKQFELIDREMTVSIHGLGLSLVNNETLQEIMYMGVASSGVIWETSKNALKRFKQMSQRDSALVEGAYQQYLKMIQVEGISASSKFVLDNKLEVDFETLTLLKPSKKMIRRTFLMGLWLQMKNSATQLQLHAKINRLQIDNQIYDCLFPVVLAPVPPPKSVAIASAHKPFMEVSIVQLLVKHSQIRQFKYFKVLIQEFHIKVELGFVNAVMEVLQAEENTEQEQLELFREDLKLVDMELYEKVSFQSLKEQKSFYDLLHFSPLKIHVSFSLAASGSSAQGAATPNFLNVLLQGLGVTLTDMQDVVFKLAYFEREYKFLTQKQLISEATSHYVGQMVKQLYVLVLGLDVLGNPYGLVLGITKGVEDLFYEPFQGAIQGPGEFAEGLVLGVRSLFGHTVGGAAGAVSLITGAMGKGLAALTFDKDYQRKRRDQINKKPATVQEGIARGGKGLVMGVYDGVTGVFTKPITGAKEKGVEGFFTGLGKGAVGLFARPTAGVIDFASGSLDAVKRATDLGEETNRLRAPRCMHSDHHLRPYNRLEAEGNRLLKELGKGKYASTDVYCYHHTIVDKKEILLLTDKRIAYVMHNDMFGGWQIEWSYTWQDLPHPAAIAPRGVHIPVSEKKRKGLFGSSDTGKTILITSPDLREQIVAEIESLRGKS